MVASRYQAFRHVVLPFDQKTDWWPEHFVFADSAWNDSLFSAVLTNNATARSGRC